MRKLKKNHAYMIEWRDHFSLDGFHNEDISDMSEEEVLFQTVGFFIREDKHYYYFVRTVGNNVTADIMAVLKSNTVSIKQLKV